MLKTAIAGLLIAVITTAAPEANNKASPKEEWKYAGEWRVTAFCEVCNDPGGTVSASGKELKYGTVAMNGVPMGSLISIEGEVFEVADRCGVDNTVDIFIPSPDGCCHCNTLEYKKIYIKEAR